MTSLPFSFLAASCTAVSNLVFRKNADKYTDTYNPSGYLVSFYVFSFVSAILAEPLLWTTPISFVALSLGGCVGVLNVLLMFLTFRALRMGPAGLTFAFQNASAIFPGILLFMLFGSEFGFSCSLMQVVGIACVLIGLFLGAKGELTNRNDSITAWLLYALGTFIVQTAALTFIQGRCILFDPPFTLQESDDIWFMPGQFGAAVLLQMLLFLREKRSLERTEALFGFFGGCVNFASTYLLLLATKSALPFEKAILFPFYAVSTTLLCNLWANRLYKEKFNFVANAVNSCGIIIGSLR